MQTTKWMIRQSAYINSRAATETINVSSHTLCFPTQMQQTAEIRYARKVSVTNIQNDVKTHSLALVCIICPSQTIKWS